MTRGRGALCCCPACITHASQSGCCCAAVALLLRQQAGNEGAAATLPSPRSVHTLRFDTLGHRLFIPDCAASQPGGNTATPGSSHAPVHACVRDGGSSAEGGRWLQPSASSQRAHVAAGAAGVCGSGCVWFGGDQGSAACVLHLVDGARPSDHGVLAGQVTPLPGGPLPGCQAPGVQNLTVPETTTATAVCVGGTPMCVQHS